MLIEYIQVSLLVAFFGVSHSLLASTRVKSLISLQDSIYRILYIIISSVIFAGIAVPVIIIARSSSDFTFELDFGLRVLLFLISYLGGLIVVISLLQVDILVFLGLKSTSEDYLVTKGLYRCSRHPMYVGTILLLVFGSIALLNAIYVWFAFLLSIYTMIGAVFEERRLLEQFPEYREYQEHVAFLVPFSIKKIRHCLFRRNLER